MNYWTNILLNKDAWKISRFILTLPVGIFCIAFDIGKLPIVLFVIFPTFAVIEFIMWIINKHYEQILFYQAPGIIFLGLILWITIINDIALPRWLYSF